MIYRVYILLHSCISYDNDRALGHFLIATQLVFKVILIALNKGEYTLIDKLFSDKVHQILNFFNVPRNIPTYAAWFESKFVRGVAFRKQVPLFNKL